MIRLVLITVLTWQVSSEQYSFDFMGSEAVVTSSAEYHGPGAFPARKLQQDEECMYIGAKLRCTYSFEVEGANETKTSILFQADCEATSQTKFDFRNAASCRCQAQVSYPNKEPKICPCTVCQRGFGENPINVDCDSVAMERFTTQETTPFIVNTCTSLDCSGACNGTCSLNCAESDTSCIYCGDAVTNQPTPLPTLGPTVEPTPLPTLGPTAEPTSGPSSAPSATPTATPSSSPSANPSLSPSGKPSTVPSSVPSSIPTAAPSAVKSTNSGCSKYYGLDLFHTAALASVMVLLVL